MFLYIYFLMYCFQGYLAFRVDGFREHFRSRVRTQGFLVYLWASLIQEVNGINCSGVMQLAVY